MSLKTVLAMLITALSLGAQIKDSGQRYSPYDLMYYGAACDGSTNDTTALNNAIAFVITSGGTLTIPQGKTCLISGQVAIPNNGASPKPLQKGLRITGSGSGSDAFGNGGSTASGGSTLDMRYSSGSTTDGKILTLGVGKLEIDHLALIDGGSDTTPFIYTTNTTILAHHNTIIGDAAGQDFIVFGGPSSTTIGSTAAAPFQGYGTVIDSNFADKIARFAYFRNFANSIQVTNNTIWGRSAGTAPFEFVGTNGGDPEGNYIAGNLIELIGYTYVAVLNSSPRNTFSGNQFWDTGGSFNSYFNCTNSQQNVFFIGHQASNVIYTKYTSGNTGSNNVIIDSAGARFLGNGAQCVDTNWDVGKIWFDTTTTTTVMKVCMFVTGSLAWVTK